LWGLVGFLLVVYVANVVGPPPPSAAAVAWSAQAMWLLVIWGHGIDRHRITVSNLERRTELRTQNSELRTNPEP
jgi:hypothetical protein